MLGIVRYQWRWLESVGSFVLAVDLFIIYLIFWIALYFLYFLHSFLVHGARVTYRSKITLFGYT